MEREGKHSLYDLSQQIHSTGEKKKRKQFYWKQMLTLRRYRRWKEFTQSLQLQKGIDGTQSPCDGSPLQLWEDSRSCVQPKMKSAWDFNMQLHQGLNLCNFSPCRMHNIYLSYILRVERQVQIKHLKKNTPISGIL